MSGDQSIHAMYIKVIRMAGNCHIIIDVNIALYIQNYMSCKLLGFIGSQCQSDSCFPFQGGTAVCWERNAAWFH